MTRPETVFTRTGADVPNPVIAFGRFKGRRMSEAPRDYLAWLANPTGRDGKPVTIRKDIRAAAAAQLANDATAFGRHLLSGQPSDLGAAVYVIERLGDLDGLTVHASLDDATAHLAAEFPYGEDEDLGGVVHRTRLTPDPEDDRILVWEILPTGHRKVVWHFSGWHWNADEFGIDQGSLTGDARSLYQMANED